MNQDAVPWPTILIDNELAAEAIRCYNGSNSIEIELNNQTAGARIAATWTTGFTIVGSQQWGCLDIYNLGSNEPLQQPMPIYFRISSIVRNPSTSLIVVLGSKKKLNELFQSADVSLELRNVKSPFSNTPPGNSTLFNTAQAASSADELRITAAAGRGRALLDWNVNEDFTLGEGGYNWNGRTPPGPDEHQKVLFEDHDHEGDVQYDLALYLEDSYLYIRAGLIFQLHMETCVFGIPCGLDLLKLALTLDLSTRLGLHFVFNGTYNKVDERTLARIPLLTFCFPIGPIPVCIVSEFKLRSLLELHIRALVDIKTAWFYHLHMEKGAEYTSAHGIRPVDVNQQDTRYDPPQLSLAIEAHGAASLVPALEISLYSIVGMGYDLRPTASLSLVFPTFCPNPPADPDLDNALRIRADFEMPMTFYFFYDIIIASDRLSFPIPSPFHVTIFDVCLFGERMHCKALEPALSDMRGTFIDKTDGTAATRQYRARSDCSWPIVPNFAQRMMITFEKFDFHSSDGVKLLLGSTPTSPLLATVTGTRTFGPLEASAVTVRLTSNEDQNKGTGFRISYNASGIRWLVPSAPKPNDHEGCGPVDFEARGIMGFTKGRSVALRWEAIGLVAGEKVNITIVDCFNEPIALYPGGLLARNLPGVSSGNVGSFVWAIPNSMRGGVYSLKVQSATGLRRTSIRFNIYEIDMITPSNSSFVRKGYQQEVKWLSFLNSGSTLKLTLYPSHFLVAVFNGRSFLSSTIVSSVDAVTPAQAPNGVYQWSVSPENQLLPYAGYCYYIVASSTIQTDARRKFGMSDLFCIPKLDMLLPDSSSPKLVKLSPLRTTWSYDMMGLNGAFSPIDLGLYRKTSTGAYVRVKDMNPPQCSFICLTTMLGSEAFTYSIPNDVNGAWYKVQGTAKGVSNTTDPFVIMGSNFCAVRLNNTAQQGIITDGSDGQAYTPFTFCEWFLKPIYETVVLYVDFLEIGDDFFQVWDAEESDGFPIATLSGRARPVSEIVSLTGRMLARFTSNEFVTGGGIEGRYFSYNHNYCQQQDSLLTARQGIVTDGAQQLIPPRNYSQWTYCQWRINPIGYDIILLKWLNVSLAAGDFVKVYQVTPYDSPIDYGGVAAGPELAVLGSTLVDLRPLLSISGSMLLRFLADGSSNAKGFMATYKSYKRGTCAPISNITTDVGTISDNSIATSYPNDEFCMWIIQPTVVCRKGITIDFTTLSTEANKDTISIHLSNRMKVTPDAVISGLQRPNRTTYASSALTVVFTTDEQNRLDGFSFNYICYDVLYSEPMINSQYEVSQPLRIRWTNRNVPTSASRAIYICRVSTNTCTQIATPIPTPGPTPRPGTSSIVYIVNTVAPGAISTYFIRISYSDNRGVLVIGDSPTFTTYAVNR
eukprot:CAMPEP_0184666180 /NCGR_PEP_ID=MMETSP0308-20130426/60317_1 /TAXON_ID=38269 /ORGANISM="Gloeochaete witrockiana, Strain SAG 46.84" /LENGTH=1384 /DNA_ID=CAMNT_0027110627 /DNA_START=542 /DNA_END=4696 /DNA_ORIENTATION=+